jgi:hypothetical protein
MYLQPVMVQQILMMMQPQPMMMMEPPSLQAPTIIINKSYDEDKFNYPSCNKGNILETKNFTCVTCLNTLVFPCSICCFPE